MGEVYRAQQVDLQREVALKVLSEDASAQKATERFLREAKMLARLDHPNLVRIYDAGKAGGRLFFAMELVEGKTLTGLLKKEGRPAPSLTARIGHQMCSAFAYIHAQDMVHRDIKPSNIMVTGPDFQTVKIMDFGIAFEKGAKRLTRTRAVVGTARYLSPEMARGETITGKSDLYQLGLVLYELLCGSPPMTGPAAVAIARRAGGERTPDPRKAWPVCPPRLAEAVNACLEPRPEDRPTPEEMGEEFQAIERKLKDWTAPEGPHEPWSSAHEEEPLLELAEDHGDNVRDSSAMPRSGRYSEQNDAFDEDFPRKRLAISVVLVLSLLYLGWWWLTPVDYRAEQMVVGRGARGVVLTWSSKTAYQSRVVFGRDEDGLKARTPAVGKDDGRQHRLIIEGLDAGAHYTFQVVFPDGKKSLEYSFTAPPKFRVRRVKFNVVGADQLEWRFQTPVPVRAALKIVTHQGKTVEHKESDPAEEHVVRFSYQEMLRDPRRVEAQFEAADGQVHAEFPLNSPISLVAHVTDLFSDQRVDWGDFFIRTEDIRTEIGQLWKGRDLPELQNRIQEMVKASFGKSGLLETWAAVSPTLGDFLHSDAPWGERRRLMDSLMSLQLLDRMYELYSLPPFFQSGATLFTVTHRLPREPEWGAEALESKVVFPYSGNLLVPLNYSAKARNRINTLAHTAFSQKGAVNTEIEGSFEMPAGPWKEVALGLEVRGVYPFSAILLDVACPGVTMDDASTFVFLSDKELVDVPISNEMDLIQLSRGTPLDDIFPPRTRWIRLPGESICPGENRVRARLLSLQHVSIFPAVARRLFVRARGGS
jgi:serine/threonine-protein kinase